MVGPLAVSNTAAPQTSWFESLPKRAQDALQQAGRRVLLVESQCLFWERVLTDAEREELGDPHTAFKQYGGIIGVWRKLNGGSQPRAIIESAYRLGHLDPASREWLQREIGESPEASTPVPETPRPAWRQEVGQLLFGTELIRRVRVMKTPSNVQIILDAFEAAGWPKSIPNPLKLGSQELHEALRSLNEGMVRIRFHSQQGAQVIYWETI